MEIGDSPWKVGLVTFLGLTIPMLLLVAAGRVEPIHLVQPGPLGPSAAMIEEEFGPDAFVRDDVGYDGQMFWVVAHHFPDLDEATPGLDQPSYRLQRILLPALASLAGGGAPSALALAVLTMAGAALCCAAVADLAMRYGRPTWTGYLALVPLLFAVALTTAEPLAYGLGFLGLCLADRDRHLAAAACITLGTLTRETAALFAVGAVVPQGVSWLRGRRPFEASWLAYGMVAVVPGLWALYVRSRFEDSYAVDRVVLLGLVQGSARHLVIGGIGVAACAVGVVLWRDAPRLALTAATYGIFTLAVSTLVLEPWHLYRIIAPGAALGLAGAAGELRRRRTTTGPAPPATARAS